jgi:hypothetical protein
MSERDLKKHLRDLSAAVTAHLADLDEEMRRPGPADAGRGSRVAKIANALDFANDRVRYFALGVDYRTDRKGQGTLGPVAPEKETRA